MSSCTIFYVEFESASDLHQFYDKNECFYQKAKKNELKNKKTFSNFKNLSSLKNSIENIKNEYIKNSKPLATRKSSELFLNLVAKIPNIISD